VPPGPADRAVEISEAALVSLDRAVETLEPYLQEQVIPTGLVINPLLDVWGAAQSIDASVAQPIEELLTALICRSATTPAELVAVLDEMRIAALQAHVLADA
jgi:hypothetical protein